MMTDNELDKLYKELASKPIGKYGYPILRIKPKDTANETKYFKLSIAAWVLSKYGENSGTFVINLYTPWDRDVANKYKVKEHEHYQYVRKYKDDKFVNEDALKTGMTKDKLLEIIEDIISSDKYNIILDDPN